LFAGAAATAVAGSDVLATGATGARSGAAGFLAHLVKPVDLEQLRAVLDRLGRPVEQRDRPE